MAEKRATKSDKLIVLFSETETAKQNQKFPFHFFFRFAVEGWGEETRGKCKEILLFLHTRVRERVRSALVSITTQSERTRQFQATTRSARAISRNQGSTQNTFELCPIHTATTRKNGWEPFARGVVASRGGIRRPERDGARPGCPRFQQKTTDSRISSTLPSPLVENTPRMGQFS